MNDEVKNIFAAEPAVKLAYLFGSRARGEAGPLSDYDFAVYLDRQMDALAMADLKFKIQSELCLALATNNIDLVVLNTTYSPEVKYNIINEGQLVYEREPFKVLVEPRIMNEYFDFMGGLRKYGLTKA